MLRSGFFIKITDHSGRCSQGEIAPLPMWSTENLDDALRQMQQLKENIIQKIWNFDTVLKELKSLNLLPSVQFGLESALFPLLSPLKPFTVPTAALFMGSSTQILEQATQREQEGFTTAKLKVSQLSFQETEEVIFQLKDRFRLRIDVNRAWTTSDSLRFFSKFPYNAFEYVEEPFNNPNDLKLFSHPLAVDESFPSSLTLQQLESLPHLKALIYKPTIQGGMLHCLPIHAWAKKRDISLVLSSSFESSLGLANIAALAHRLSLTSPIGIGTYAYFKDPSHSNLQITSGCITLKM